LTSAARAPFQRAHGALALPCTGLASRRPSTTRPAFSKAASNSARLRRPRCSARSDRISQPSPCGVRCSANPARKPSNMRLPSSYTANSIGELGRAGSQGGLHRISEARPGGNRSARTTCTWAPTPSCARLASAQAMARGSWSVATTVPTWRRASTAESTPVPVPTSNATIATPPGSAGGRGTLATRSMYSPRTGEKTP